MTVLARLLWPTRRFLSYLESVPRDKRTKRDLHALDENGMVVCNPRDREAAHRAQVEAIATDDYDRVSCKKCRARLKDKRREG